MVRQRPITWIRTRRGENKSARARRAAAETPRLWLSLHSTTNLRLSRSASIHDRPRRCRCTRCAGSSPTMPGTPTVGLMLARLILSRLLAADAAIEVVVDDTLFRRWGPKVFGAFWTHDGSAQDPNALGRGNRWIIIGIVVTVPFCSRPVCLPVLLRLWRGKGHRHPGEPAGDLIRFWPRFSRTDSGTPSGTPPTTARRCWCPLPRSPPGCPPTPPSTLWRRRAPAGGADPDPKAPGSAVPPTWPTPRSGAAATITRYGRSVIVEIADIPSIWYGAFGNTPAAPSWSVIPGPSARAVRSGLPRWPTAVPQNWASLLRQTPQPCSFGSHE